ncbi:MAG: sulfotransferase domain-containing protein [Pirellulales bacterium]
MPRGRGCATNARLLLVRNSGILTPARANAMLPDFFVIGAQKAGSTYLLECLREHPEVFMPAAEIAFFEDPFYAESRLEQFESNFAAARPGQKIGVKRPNVLGCPECPERLKKHLPAVKLIAVLRKPLERTISGYFHYMASGFIPIANAEVGLRKLLAGEYEKYPRAHEILDFSMYGQHLERYIRTLDREQITVVLLDDLKRNQAAELARLYRVIGVDERFQPKASGGRPMQAIYSLPRLRMRVWMERASRGYGNDRAYTYGRRGLLATPCRVGAMAIDRFVLRPLFPAGPPEISAELTQTLQEKFEPDIERLEERLGRDLSHWKRSESASRTIPSRSNEGVCMIDGELKS